MKKDRTVCKVCYNFKKRKHNKTLIQNQQPKIVKVKTNNNRTLLFGPSFWGKTQLMLKILSRITHQDMYIVTRSTPDQYSYTKINIKEISEEIKPLNENENAIIVFDDLLGASNSRYIDEFFIRGTRKK